VEAVRPATEDDLGALIGMARAALVEMAPARGGALYIAREGRADPLQPTLEADLASSEASVWIGTFDEVPLGYAVGRIEELRDGTRLGRITDLYVDRDARGVGVGEALMTAMIPWFESAGCRGIDADALPGDRSTKNFFETAGFTARLLVMHHRLGPDPESADSAGAQVRPA